MKKTYEKPTFQKTQYISMDNIATEAESFDSVIDIVPLTAKFSDMPGDWGEVGGIECGCKTS